ncbi:MAG: AAA family ATPase [Chloroflexi bacterium]|nr:AAA family ATPase [Chloroflexota bacterium]MBI4332178.1 AAA family ATPase [Chloroflexota bacterium]
MITRISTGIEGLDRLTDGGFINGKVYLVSGECGTGKTIFGLQYLRTGLERGENGIYISGDEKPAHLVTDAEALGWQLGDYVREHRLGLLDVSPFFRDMRAGKARDVDTSTVIADLARHVKQIDARRIVIDPIAPLIFKDESQPGLREYIRSIVFAMEDNLGCTVLITSGTPSGTSALSQHGVAEFVVEGVIVLSIRQYQGRRTRALFVRKMRCTPANLDEHAFQIVPDKGIVLGEVCTTCP